MCRIWRKIGRASTVSVSLHESGKTISALPHASSQCKIGQESPCLAAPQIEFTISKAQRETAKGDRRTLSFAGRSRPTVAPASWIERRSWGFPTLEEPSSKLPPSRKTVDVQHNLPPRSEPVILTEEVRPSSIGMSGELPGPPAGSFTG